jgi:hypothetical protein
MVASPSMEARRVYHSNIKVLFFGVLFRVNFFNKNSMEITWYSLFLGSFVPQFQIKFSTND